MEGAPQLNLDGLGGSLADEQVVLALDVLRDGLVHLVSGDAHRPRVDYSRKRDDGDVCGPAADVNDHVAVWLCDGESGTDGRAHRLFDEVDLRSLSAVGRVFDGAALDLCDLAGYADDDSR